MKFTAEFKNNYSSNAANTPSPQSYTIKRDLIWKYKSISFGVSREVRKPTKTMEEALFKGEIVEWKNAKFNSIEKDFSGANNTPGSGAYTLPGTLSKKGIKIRPEDKTAASTRRRNQAFSSDSRVGPGSYNMVGLIGSKQRSVSTKKNAGYALMPKGKRTSSVIEDKGSFGISLR